MSILLSKRRLLKLLGAAALTPGVAFAQSPDRVTLVVPYPPGSAPDLLARILANKMAAASGKPAVVENRPGANAIIGSDYVSKARPDGSTLLVVDRMTLVANPLLYSKLPYDPRQLVGVSDLAKVDLLLTVRSDAPYRSWAEFVAYARANPGKVSIGSGGPGSVHHLSLELMGKATGAEFTHVPYKGVSLAVTDMLGGQLSGVITGPELMRAHVPTGKVRVLAIGADQRSPLFPDVPTLKELGVASPFLLPTTFTLFAPAGTPPAVVDQLSESTRKLMAEPDVAARLSETGVVPGGSRPDEIRAALAQLAPRLATVVREANIRLD
jgi:tripartite-type tricarboxylate transporter receptor subunit TctC